MIYKLIAGDKLKVVLTSEETRILGISYDSLERSLSHTKRILLRLLEEAGDAAGFRPGPDAQLYIEIYPNEHRGCTVYFTALPEEDEAPNRAYDPVVFAFQEPEGMISASIRLFSWLGHRLLRSALYRLDGTYFLIIHPLDGSDGLTAGFLSEYGERLRHSALSASYVEEHGLPILTERAVDTLSYYFDHGAGP